MKLENRCKIATDSLPVSNYRTRLEKLHADLLALRKDAPIEQCLFKRVVKPPRKSDLARLESLLQDWRRQEAKRSIYELAVIPGSMRGKQIKDADALAYIRACCGEAV